MSEVEPRHLTERFVVEPGKPISLKRDFDPGYTAEFLHKKEARSLLRRDIERLALYQERLFAQKRHGLLILFQGMDTAGKDSVIKHVMTGLNPQGCQVWSFKSPSTEELEHDYLWRCSRRLPPRGVIGIFNRSYYEEVVVVRVHPELLEREQLPADSINDSLWRRRFKEINAFEQYLVDNGIVILKFFLYLSRDEQKERFLERIERSEKNWKFSTNDVRERGHWEAYMNAYEALLNHTSTSAAPWYVVPADHKWFTRLGVASVIAETLKRLHPEYPELMDDQRQDLVEAKKLLEAEA